MTGTVRNVRHLPLALVVILALGGCASGGSRAGGTLKDFDRITLEELEPLQGRDALSAIQSLRPRWLQVRSSRTFISETVISVIVDDIPQGLGVGLLRGLAVESIRELRYLSAADATTRFGPDMAGGAILVYRKNR